MVLTRWRRLVSSTFALLAMCGIALSTGAETVSSVSETTLPALPANIDALKLTNIDGRAIALTSDSAWLLDEERQRWTPLQWRGEDAGEIFGDGQQSFVAAIEPESREISIARLAIKDYALVREPLPKPNVALTEAVGTQRGDSLYVAGVDASGQSHLLQYTPLSAEPRWIDHPGWTGNGKPTSITIQNSAVYVTVDSGVEAEGAAQINMWRRTDRDGWQRRGPVTTEPLRAARPIGQAHILYLAGTGNATSLLSYHTISDAWATLPYGGATPIAATPRGTGFLMAFAQNGQVAFKTAELGSAKRLLAGLDWIIIIVYLGSMIAVGVYFYMRHRQGSAAEFFVGSRSIPFWAAGVSLYATNTSSISYIAIPAKAFETDWQYMMSKLVTVVGLMFVAVMIVPLLRRLNLVSVFNYLEMRFHPTIRMLASALCMLMHVGGRMSVVLFLPALAIATITGIDVEWSIIIMGVCTIVYTAMGGMRAVIWTDFTQVIVLMGGAIFAIGFIFFSLGGETVYETAAAFDKTKLVNLSFDLTEPTVWGFLFLILFDTVLTFPKDQVLMQRTLATDSDRNAGRSIWIFAAIMIPGGLIFYGIGTVLFVYYKQHPERLDPLLPIDATFPLFIAAELPPGLTGLIIAGIFAAAMGTLSSTINSVATLLSVDFFEKLARNPTPERSVKFAEWMSVVVGVIAIGLALLLSRLDIHSLLDLTIELAGLLGGGFAGAYTLGMFTRRANSAGVSIGVAAALVVTLVARWFELVHPYFYLGISIFVCIVVGYLASLFFPAPTRSLAGLTIFKDA